MDSLIQINHLDYLDLSENKIKTIYKGSNISLMANRLDGLIRLFLSQNLIERIQLNFDIFNELTYLDMSSNLIELVTEEDLANLKKLQTLKLSNNRILFISENIFSPSNLQYLFLGGNLGVYKLTDVFNKNLIRVI